MATNQKSVSDGASSRQRITNYLLDRMNDGKHYFKSKYIAQDLGMSVKEVGANLGLLSGECEMLYIERWSYSNSTTWRVESKSVPVPS